MSPKSSIYEIKDSTVLEFQVGDLDFLYTVVPYGSIIDVEWIIFCSSGTIFPAMAFVRRHRSGGRAFPRPRMYTTLAHPVESACRSRRLNYADLYPRIRAYYYGIRVIFCGWVASSQGALPKSHNLLH